jgi:hypothetical protein
MSISRSHRPIRPSHSSPEVCARSLGQLIRAARKGDDRPLEQIAPLAALTVEEWEAIEAGYFPYTWEQVCLIIAALHLGRSWLPYLLRAYAGIQPQ